MNQETSRHDPVEFRYSKIESFERFVDFSSWMAIGAFAVYAVLHYFHSSWDAAAKLSFVAVTVAAVTASYWLRFYLQPPADRQRRRLLIKDGTGAMLTAQSQRLYWNNEAPHSLRRLLLNLAENTFYQPRLLRAELGPQTVMVVSFSFAMMVSLRLGTAELVELFAVLLVFGEILLGKLVRMTWTLTRMRHLHVEVVSALRETPADAGTLTARALYILSEYEYIKGRAGYRASDRTFARLNPLLTEQWVAYRDTILRPGTGTTQPSAGNGEMVGPAAGRAE